MFIRIDDTAINLDDVTSFYVDDDEIRFDMKSDGGSWEFGGFEDEEKAREFFTEIFSDILNNKLKAQYKTPEYEEEAL